jgi:hypothetical protein
MGFCAHNFFVRQSDHVVLLATPSHTGVAAGRTEERSSATRTSAPDLALGLAEIARMMGLVSNQKRDASFPTSYRVYSCFPVSIFFKQPDRNR